MRICKHLVSWPLIMFGSLFTLFNVYSFLVEILPLVMYISMVPDPTAQVVAHTTINGKFITILLSILVTASGFNILLRKD